MKTLFVIVLFVAAVLLSAQISAIAQDRGFERCTVVDPTGTPLNVRSNPGGKKIVGKLKNGTIVYVENYSGDAKDQSWAEVRLKRSSKTKPLGWVLQDFLVCEEVN